ncbi:hypothetical protein BBJ28_00003161 [Nothophytophthora sp. Chile5]|nr:hypothetical protein BBJ28_00003161 [Nothophytophthora sp. Chile5]
MLLPSRMDSNPWAMTAAATGAYPVYTRADEPMHYRHRTAKYGMQQSLPGAVKRYLTSSSPSINLAATSSVASAPLLPSLGSISPANTTTTARLVGAGDSSLLAPLRFEYCRFQGCANFGRMQGYCHDHIHGQPATHQAHIQPPTTAPFSHNTAPLPSIMRPATAAPQPQYLPALHTVVRPPPTCNGPATYPGRAQPNRPAVASPPYPSALGYNKRQIIYTDHTRFISAPLSKKPRVIASPTPSTGSSGGSQLKAVAKCRREGCGNDARRKGLCMEHGGRHFCKMAGCQKCAHRGGFCISHGGGRRCAVANCGKSAQSGGICYSHGGGKRCATDGCTHAARSGGFCIKHGKQQQRREI